jgi:putrescine aminotransferase
MADRDPAGRRAAAVDRVDRFNMPGRLATFAERGTLIVMGRREGYRFWDLDGREFIDLHLNGGVFNLGHRNPRLLDRLRTALPRLDIGNHHFVSEERGALAARLAELTPADLTYSIFTGGGGEAIDVAIRSARRTTGRRHVIGIKGGFHGRTGLSGAVGDPSTAERFLSDLPADFSTVPFDDLAALEARLGEVEAAAFLLEPIPATLGFPMPGDDYLKAVRRICDEHGALLILDEIQTGLGRTGSLWAAETFGIQPDILVTGKGLGGGLYPVAAAVHTPRAASWLRDDGWGYVASASGAELGMEVAMEVLDLTTEPATQARIEALIARLARRLAALRECHEVLREVRQCGLVIGLSLDSPEGGLLLNRALFERGVWAYPAGFDPSVLQFKVGLLMDDATCEEVLDRLDDALGDLGGRAST